MTGWKTEMEELIVQNEGSFLVVSSCSDLTEVVITFSYLPFYRHKISNNDKTVKYVKFSQYSSLFIFGQKHEKTSKDNQYLL